MEQGPSGQRKPKAFHAIRTTSQGEPVLRDPAGGGSCMVASGRVGNTARVGPGHVLVGVFDLQADEGPVGRQTELCALKIVPVVDPFTPVARSHEAGVAGGGGFDAEPVVANHQLFDDRPLRGVEVSAVRCLKDGRPAAFSRADRHPAAVPKPLWGWKWASSTASPRSEGSDSRIASQWVVAYPLPISHWLLVL